MATREPTVVTVDELRDYMSSIGLTIDQTEAARDVLVGVQGELETHLNVLLERATITGERLVLDETGWGMLRGAPVVSTTSVTVEDASYSLVLSAYTVTRNGHVHAPYWGHQIVLATYVAGYDRAEVEAGGGPDRRAFDTCRLAIMRAAAREMATNHDDSLTIADLNTSAPPRPDLPLGMQEAELRRIDRLRRRVFA